MLGQASKTQSGDGSGGAQAGGNTPEWAAYKDPNTGMRFWYNHVTGASQWETPEGYDENTVPEPSWEEQQHHDVEEIHNLDDLGI